MIQSIKIIFELLAIPDVRIGTWRVFRHRFTQATYNPLSEILLLLVEPGLTLAALALGLGTWVNQIDGKPYAIYVLPAVVAVTTVFVPYWETAYGVFSRLKSQQGYWAVLQSPIDATDLATGEILWATVKGTVAGAILMVVGILLGWCHPLWSWLAFAALIPGAMLFAAIGLWGASWAKRSMTLLMIQSFVLGPLALWSDTVFPFSTFGTVAEVFAWGSPVTHVVRPIRSLFSGELTAQVFLSLAIVWVIASVVTNGAVMKFRRRLVPQ